MNKKKLLALLMALVMTLSLMPVTAFAEGGNVAKIGSNEYETLQAAIAAANDGDTVTLINDAIGIGSDGIQVPTNLTLDLNGHTISNGDDMIMAVSSGKNLVIKDETGEGKIISAYNNDGAFLVNPGSSIVLEGGTVINEEGSPFGTTSNASVVINGGKVVTNNSVAVAQYGAATLTVSGGEIEAGKLLGKNELGIPASVSATITGGSFKGMTASTTANKIDENAVAAGYKVVEEGDWYKVVLDVPNVAKIGDTPYATLAAAFAAANQASEAVTIQVLQNCTLDQVVTIAEGKTVTLDLDGKTVTVTNENIVENGIVVTSTSDGSKKTNAYDVEYTTTNACGKTVIQNNGTFTITGVGTIDATGLIDASATYFNKGTNNNGNTLYMINNSGELTIVNGTFNMFTELKTVVVRNANEATLAGGSYSSWSTVLNDGGGKMDITGGTYTGWAHAGNPGGWRYAVAQYGLESEMTISDGVSVSGIHGGLGVSEGKLTVNGGTFESRTETGATAYRAGYFAGEKGNVQIIINGGTFQSAGYEAILVGNKNTSGDGGEAIPISGIINGGTFIRKKNSNSVSDNAIKVSANSELIINGGYFDGTVNSDGVPSNVVVSGGEFSVDPSQLNSTNGATIADGYEVVNNGDATYLYKVQAKSVAQIGTTKYATLQAAIEAANASEAANVTINLLADCDTGSFTNTSALALTKANTVLNLNNHTITVNNNFSFVMAADNITVKDGKIYSADNAAKKTGYNSYVLVIGGNEKADTITGVRVVNVETRGGVSVGGSEDADYMGIAKNVVLENCNITSGDYYAVCSQNYSTLTIKSGTYISNSTVLHENADSTISPHVLYAAFKNADGPEGYISVIGGYYSGTINTSNTEWVTISGGYFSTQPAAGLIKTGYEAVENTDPTTRDTYGWTIGVIKDAFKEVENTAKEPVTTTSGDTTFSFATTTTDNTDVTYAIKTTTTGGQDDQVAYTPVQTDVVTKPAVSATAADASGVTNEDKVAEVANEKTAVEASAASGTTKIQAKQGEGNYGDVDLLTTQAAANAITKAAAAYTGEANEIAKVEIQLQTELTSYTLAEKDESVVTTALIYQVTPQAVLLNASGVQLGEAQTLTNSDLNAQNLTLQFRLPVPDSAAEVSGQVIVTHRSSDSTYGDSTSLLTVEGTAGNHYVIIETTHFSEFELKPYVVAGTNELISASLTLGGSIDINFYMRLTESVKSIRFTFTDEAGNESVKTVAVTADKYNSSTGEYKFSYPIAAKDIYQPIKLEMLDVDGQPAEFSESLTEFSYSVTTYLDYIISNSTDEEMVSLARALGVYGSYAHDQILGTSKYTRVSDDNYGTISEGSYDSEISYLVGGYEVYNSYPSDKLLNPGMTLLLRTETVVANRFDYVGSDFTNYQFYYQHADANGSFDNSPEYEVEPVHTGNYWYVESNGIPAAELNRTIKFIVKSGETVVYSTNYGPMFYAKSKVNSQTTSDLMKNTVRALYDYNQKAIAVFNNN